MSRDTVAGTPPAVIEQSGTATDVVQRGQDGLWRYLIDNPFGTAWVT
jgi:hypothetical protein